jgi:biotin synthase
MPPVVTAPVSNSAISVEAIEALADAIIAGKELSAAEARPLLELRPGTPEGDALLAAARSVRQHFLGNRVSFCSIVNAKAGNCSENCTYCTQASDATTEGYDKGGWIDDEAVLKAAESAANNGAGALGLVAAWKGVKEGTQLDMVCDTVRRLAKGGVLRTDVNLGILESQTVADRLYEAGARVYGHNLETARSFFDQTCETHDFEERWKTIQYIRSAGMGLCSGGIIGLGESLDQRIEFAEQLRFIEPQMIPINFLNPQPGTALEGKDPVDPDEALITLAVFRLFLPNRNIMVAGGKEITFGERLAEVFDAGINSVMVGNYLTTLGTSPEWWQEQVRAHGMEVASGCGVHEDEDSGCGSGCGC